MLTGGLALIVLGFVLGLRHGIDWDHIAAITDITSSTISNKEAEIEGQMMAVGAGGSDMTMTLGRSRAVTYWNETSQGFFLASLYALGHASVVTLLGLLAIWIGAILPEWVDPLMERIVGVTLILLGLWICYSLWRYGRSFRLQSRWMVVFALVGRAWQAVKHRVSGHTQEHDHHHAQEIAQYGAKAAFGIGVLHGIGAETGSQALLLASAAGATTALSGSLMLLSFVVGLLVSNSIVAVFSLAGFVSSSTKRNVYLVIGILAAGFSLAVGIFFVTGKGAALPDLQALLDTLFGKLR